MLPLDSASVRPACRRRQAPIRSRPVLEHLEPRLPPGDAFLGILASARLVGTRQSNRELVSTSAVRLASTPNVAATSAIIAEVAAFSDPAGSTLSDDTVATHFLRQQRLSNSESPVTNSWNDWLTDSAGGQMLVGQPQSLPAESRMGVEFTPMRGAPIEGMQTANPQSIPSGLAAVAVSPLQTAETTATNSSAEGGYHSPFYFEKNVGQADESLDFVARGAGYTLGLSATEAIMTMQGPEADRPNLNAMTPEEKAGFLPDGHRIGAENVEPASGMTVRMQLAGGNSHATVAAVDPLVTKVNYFLGSDPDHWHTNVPTFGRVQYDDVYPGVDLVYYGNNGRLEYDFVVSPGADPKAITLNFAGADSVEVNGDGDLVLHTAAGDVVQQAPLTYQEFTGARQEVPSRYVIDSGRVSFQVGAYDATRPLVIDPLVLGYSTYLGAGGTLDAAFDIAVDNNGNAYVVGDTSSVKFPVTQGAFDETYNVGSYDTFVAKLAADGSGLIYATYLGGVNEDTGRAIAVDAAGSAYVTGWTLSEDFPTMPGSLDTFYNLGVDAYVTKLNEQGNELVYSTYLGGSSFEHGFAITVDETASAYVTGGTASTDFPVTPGALDTTYNRGVQDVFVVKLNPVGASLSYATYLGGSDNDAGYGIAVSTSGQAYVVGTTESLNFSTTPGAFDETYNGSDENAYVVKLTPDGSALAYSTYLAGSDGASAYNVAMDGDGNAFVVGITQSDDFPVTPGAYDTVHEPGSGNDGFVTKLNSAASELLYSTFLGAGSYGAISIALDNAGSAYLTGIASSGLETTPDAFDQTHNGSFDSFFMRLTPDGSTLAYSTFLGGQNSDVGRGLTLDAAGNVYIAGETQSGDFPTTPNAFKRRNRPGTLDGFVTKFTQL